MADSLIDALSQLTTTIGDLYEAPKKASQLENVLDQQRKQTVVLVTLLKTNAVAQRTARAIIGGAVSTKAVPGI